MIAKGVSPPPRQLNLAREQAQAPNTLKWLTELDRWLQILSNSYPRTRTYEVAWDPSSVAANTLAEQTVTVTGLATTDIVTVNKPTYQTGLLIAHARVSAADTLAVVFANFTGAPIDPSNETYLVLATRR